MQDQARQITCLSRTFDGMRSPDFLLFSVPKCILFIFWRHDNWKSDVSGSLNTFFPDFLMTKPT